MTDIVYKEESYEIIGHCFEVFNALGHGLHEKNYQKALEESFSGKKVNFTAQLHVPLKFNDKVIGKYYLDFLIDDIIALELKVGDHFKTKDIEQLYAYLKSKNLKLGLLVYFTSKGVRYKRILNVK